jgi:hypothetical protein
MQEEIVVTLRFEGFPVEAHLVTDWIEQFEQRKDEFA